MGRIAVGRPGLVVPGIIAWPLLTVGLAGVLWGVHLLGRPNAPTTVQSHGPRIEDIRTIAKLAVLRVQVADVIEGQTRGARAIVLVHGDSDIAIDVDRIEVVDRNEQQRTATLCLPTPRPDRPRVDHDRTRIFALEKTGLAAINPFADPRGLLLTDCMHAAQAQVESAVAEPEYVLRAKQHAELLLAAFYREMGWDVAVAWK
jgi:hypothetical protein